jgi:hypothetical protein
MRNVSDKNCRKNQNPHFMFNNVFAAHEIMWKNLIEPDRRMQCACWVPEATGTNTSYLILTALPRQQWLRECPSLLHYTYVACFLENRMHAVANGVLCVSKCMFCYVYGLYTLVFVCTEVLYIYIVCVCVCVRVCVHM